MVNHRILSTILLYAAGVFAAPLLADIQFTIEEPSKESTKSGIGLISGWAVSDRKIVMVEAFIDGASLGEVPYGGSRQDVAAVFPEIQSSEFSGWAVKWNYALHEDGEHTLTVVVTEDNDNQVTKEVVFNTIGFHSPFISNPADVLTVGTFISSVQDGRIVIEGAEVEGESIDIELAWDTASQQFLIDIIDYGPEQEENQPPTANAGADRKVEQGASVLVKGSASDSDGTIASWSWQQISGPEVSLSNADSAEVQFTAPETVGNIRLRLTVRDDDGAADSDDIVIEVQKPAPPPNSPPTADAGPNRTAQTGETVTITGNGSDSDGEIVAWNWQQISGPTVTLLDGDTQTVRFTAPDTDGVIYLRLTVSDDDGASDSDDVRVTVEAPVAENQPPSANAGADREVDQGDNVLVAGSASDPDGIIASWSWQQISGPEVSLSNADSAEVQFTAPATAGDIRLRLTVSDDDGAADSDDIVITVRESSGTDNTTGETLQSMLPFINQARSADRFCGDTEYPARPDLVWSNSLAKVARDHSMDMARQGYFSHTSADGTSMGNRVFSAWSGTRVGENIAASSVNRSDSYVVDLWLNSPGHCALIMDPDFTHAGVGSGHNTENGYNLFHFWTLDFGG